MEDVRVEYDAFWWRIVQLEEVGERLLPGDRVGKVRSEDWGVRTEE